MVTARKTISNALRAVFCISLLALCAACTGAPGESAVAQAYAKPGLINPPPYTRTIFSSHNF